MDGLARGDAEGFVPNRPSFYFPFHITATRRLRNYTRTVLLCLETRELKQTRVIDQSELPGG